MRIYEPKSKVINRLITFVNMQLLKKLLDFYIKGSIHVALAVYALVRMTFHFFSITYDEPMAYFAFFGTIVGYNFVKYDALARTNKVQLRASLKLIILFSALSFLAVGYLYEFGLYLIR